MPNEGFNISFNKGRCKKCGLCVHYCPRGVIARDEQGYPRIAEPEKCKHCYLCFHRCPDFALEVKEDGNKVSAG